MSLRKVSPVHPLALAVSALVTAMVMPAQAQQPSPTGTMLEEVVVTAEKRTESLQEVPIAITAFSQKDIEQRGISNVADLLGQIPSVGGFTAPGSRGNTSLSIRGVSGGSPSNLSLDPAVGIYLDGVYLGKMTGVSVDVAELERIEVLRGPQGTLYGRNSTGGAVNYITRKPTGEFGVRATGSAGNHDYYAAQINVDTPSIGQVGVGAGQLAASFGVQTRDRDGFYENTTNGDDFNDLDRQAWRVALAWDITENLRADYAYDGSQLDEVNNLDAVVGFNGVGATQANRIAALQGTLARAQGWAAAPGTDPRIASRWIPSLEKTIDVYQESIGAGEGRRNSAGIDITPRSKSDVQGHGLTLAWDKDDITFKSITGYRDSTTKARGDIDSIDSRNDADGIAAWNDFAHLTLGSIYGATGGINLPFLPVDAFWNEIDAQGGALHFSQHSQSDYDQFSQEFQIIGSTDQFEYVGGLYYFDDTAKYDRTSTSLVPVAPIGDARYKMTTEAWAAYGQTTWTPGWLDNRLSFTAGLRYTEEDKDIDWDWGEAVGALSGTTPAMQASNDKSFDNVSGSFTVAYQATDEINTYFRYGNGYRSGGFNGESFDSKPFEEETIDQYELGVKSELWDSRLRINAAVYTYTYDDLQVSLIETSDTGPTTFITNAGKAERWGGELEILVAPIDDLIIGASYAYIHGDFDEFPDLCGTAVPVTCLEGKDFAERGGSPDNQFNLYADYVFARTSWGEVTGYLNLNWQDEWYASAAYPALVNTAPRGAPPATVPVLYENREMDGRTLIDARLSLENVEVGDGMMRFTLWGKNLTDEDYPLYGINFGNEVGLITQNYGDPRTYGIEVAYEY
ncbi:MAG: TonB-dependent receptor [Halioglobus sp.]|nr:TonB-dependent receptor [Halioglobus sp.]